MPALSSPKKMDTTHRSANWSNQPPIPSQTNGRPYSQSSRSQRCSNFAGGDGERHVQWNDSKTTSIRTAQCTVNPELSDQKLDPNRNTNPGGSRTRAAL